MQENAPIPSEYPRKKVRNIDRHAHSSHKPCSCDEGLIARINQLEEDVSRKDAIIEKLRLDRDVSMDASSRSVPFSGSAYDGPPGYKTMMESTITHQNILIESLQENLRLENEKCMQLSQEFFSNKDQSSKEIMTLKNEIDDLQKRIATNVRETKEIWSENNEKLESMKKILEEECNDKIDCIANDLRKKHDNELNKLKADHNAELEAILQSCSLKESFLLKQVELLSSRVIELYERDISHDTELQASRQIYEHQFNELKLALDEVTKREKEYLLPEQIKSLNDKLAESLTNEITLKAELNSCKKELENIKKEYGLASQTLSESVETENLLSNRIKSMERKLLQFKEENNLLIATLHNEREMNRNLNDQCNASLNDFKKQENELINSFQQDISAVHDALKDLWIQLNAISREYLQKNGSSSSQASQESIVSSYKSDLSSEKESQIKDVNTLLHLIRESYNCVCHINSLSNNYNHLSKLYDELNQENESMKNQISELKLNSKKCQLIEAHVETLQDELNTINEEKMNLKTQLIELEENYIDRNEYNQLITERNNLQVNLKNSEQKIDRLLKEIEELRSINIEIKKRIGELTDKNRIQSMNRDAGNENQSRCSQLELKTHEHKIKEDLVNTPDSKDFDFEYSHKKKNKMSQVITSTPYFKKDRILYSVGDGESLSLNMASNDSYVPLINWIEKCQILELENVRLIHEAETLKVRVKDLEYGAQVTQEEIRLLEIKKQKLESKVTDYLDLKEKLYNVMKSDEENAQKIQDLICERDLLMEKNISLSKDNLQIENKFKEYVENMSSDKLFGVNNDVIKDLSMRIQEVVFLKEELYTVQDANKKLLQKLENLTEMKNCALNKFSNISVEFSQCQAELENIFKENTALATSKKMLEKELEVSKMRIGYLTSALDSRSTKLSQNLIEDMHRELIHMCKHILEEKYSTKKIQPVDKESNHDGSENLDARHQIQILIKNNTQLEIEKEDLLGRVIKQQEIIREYEENQGLDEERVTRLDKLQSDLINELRSHTEQYARIEEALRSTGNLHNELQKQKDQTRMKIREICNLEKKLEEERGIARSAKMRLKLLEQELELKDDLLQKATVQKNNAEDKLLAIQKTLIEGEAKFQLELKGKDWKLKEANLLLSNSDVEKSVIRYECGDTQSTFHTSAEEERLRNLQSIELDYSDAIKRVRYYYMAQYASDAANIQEHHLEQV